MRPLAFASLVRWVAFQIDQNIDFSFDSFLRMASYSGNNSMDSTIGLRKGDQIEDRQIKSNLIEYGFVEVFKHFSISQLGEWRQIIDKIDKMTRKINEQI